MQRLKPEEMWEDVWVDGQLRRLRRGLTTGTTAAAAAKAALLAFWHQKVPAIIEVPLPNGRRAGLPILRSGNEGQAAVVKDGGDDPDATHGAEIVATISRHPGEGILISGGQGVGRVTRPGLAVPVGDWAINPVPRRQIRLAMEEVIRELGADPGGIEVRIHVPEGERIARDTWNGRLGILGGISILGSTGLVRPYSLASWRASVVMAIHVAAATGTDTIVLTTGSKTHEAAMTLWPGIGPEAVIDMGGFFHHAVVAVTRQPGIRRLGLVAMMGKLSKIANGARSLHAHDASVDLEFLAQLVRAAGAPDSLVAWVARANTAAEVGEQMQRLRLQAFFDMLALKAARAIADLAPALTVEVVLLDRAGVPYARVALAPGGNKT